eukprot:jgi/Tetstr1/437415/TSEL_026097.t1
MSLKQLCLHALGSELLRPTGSDTHQQGRQQRLAAAVPELPADQLEALWNVLAGWRLLRADLAWGALWQPTWVAPRRELSLAGCVLLSGQEVAAHIASTCTALTSLSLAGILTVKDADVRTVCRAAGGLEHVDLTGCCGLGDHAVQALSGLRSLRWLSLARCWQVRGVGPLQHCPELRSLNLGGCWQVGDTELGDLLSGLHHLEELQLPDCGSVGTASLRRLPCPVLRSSLHTLNIRGTRVCEDLMRLLAAEGRSLTSLDISYACVQGPAVASLLRARAGWLGAEGGQPLRHLGVAGVGGTLDWGEVPAEQGVRTLHMEDVLGEMGGSAAAALTSLDASCGGAVTHVTLRWLGAALSGLQRLVLSNCRLPASAEALLPLATLTRLTHLDLNGSLVRPTGRRTPGSGFWRPHKRQRVSQAAGEGPAEGRMGDLAELLAMPSLRCACLSGSSVTDAALGRAEGLTRLDISQCKRVTEHGLLQVLLQCPRLRTLCALGCSSVAGPALGAHCPPTLQSLSLPAGAGPAASIHAVLQPRHAAPPALALGAPLWAAAKGLGHVHLKGCTKLMDADVLALARGAPMLTVLELNQAAQLTDASLCSIASHLPLLRKLAVTGAANITDAGIGSLVASGSNLQSLDLSKCRRLTDRAAGLLAEGCSALASLAVDSCDLLTPAGFQQVLRSCPHLQSLSARSTLADDAVLVTALSTCANMRTLCLGGCPAVSGSFSEQLEFRSTVTAAEGTATRRPSPAHPHPIVAVYLQRVDLPLQRRNHVRVKELFDRHGWLCTVRIHYV